MVGCVLTVLAGVLLAGSALAQQAPPLARRELSVTLSGDPAARLPELRAALGVETPVFFDSDLRLDSLEVDRARIELVGMGPRFIIFKPVVRLGADERVILRVRYMDGNEPSQAVFAIVSHPSEVNTRVEVTRRAQPAVAECQAALAGAHAPCAPLTPTRAARAGLWDSNGVRAARLIKCRGSGGPALKCMDGWAYVAEAWGLLKVKVLNAPGQPPWSPREATLRGQRSGAQVHVRTVEAEPAVIAPGGEGEVFVECDVPKSDGEVFTLELRDAGRSLTLAEVEIARPVGQEEKKP